MNAQLKACLEEIGEAEGLYADETLVTLMWSYDWLYRSACSSRSKKSRGRCSDGLTWMKMITRRSRGDEREQPEDRFVYIQELYRQHAHRL
jgi:hypothetical protein